MKTLLTTLAALLSASAIADYAPEGYSIVTVDTPKDIRFHVTGMDIDPDGSVVCATRLGDVWRLRNNNWTLIADGLHEPTGLLIDDDRSILVAQKPELTRLVDTDSDGLIDEYIRVADGWEFHDNYHEFNFGPVNDKKGNLYGTLNLGHQTIGGFKYKGGMDSAGGHRGWAYKVTPKGEYIPLAWGLRSPAGLGISPKNEVFYTDNQGDWVGTSKIHLIGKNEFYGHPVSLQDLPEYSRDKILKLDADDFDKMRTKPNIWIPHQEVANSPGNMEWNLTKGKFGPFENQIFVGDQTQSNIFRVLLDKVKGEYQGAVINFIDGFQSGNIRVEFDNQGQLWVGQTARGWASKGGKLYGLEKVVWDGTHPFELHNIKLNKKGFTLYFTEALDPKTVTLDSFSIENWHYNYHQKYGSAKVDVQKVAAKKVKLSRDKKSLKISLPLDKEKVYGINFDGLRNKNGKQASTNIVYYTLNKLL